MSEFADKDSPSYESLRIPCLAQAIPNWPAVKIGPETGVPNNLSLVSVKTINGEPYLTLHTWIF